MTERGRATVPSDMRIASVRGPPQLWSIDLATPPPSYGTGVTVLRVRGGGQRGTGSMTLVARAPAMACTCMSAAMPMPPPHAAGCVPDR